MSVPNSGQFLDGSHRIPFRVYYEDTDAGGVMYYANYLRFAERARTEALRAMGIEQHALAGQGFLFVVRRVEIDYLAPSRLDDILTVETSLQRTTKVRMSMRQRLSRAERDVARLLVDIVTVDAAGFRPVPLPDAIHENIISHLRPREQGEIPYDG
jgi:acyl-CoA thioester hydrolase